MIGDVDLREPDGQKMPAKVLDVGEKYDRLGRSAFQGVEQEAQGFGLDEAVVGGAVGFDRGVFCRGGELLAEGASTIPSRRALQCRRDGEHSLLHAHHRHHELSVH